jgi:heme/copper-type cytochrome/quinol oxidase subunit 1
MMQKTTHTTWSDVFQVYAFFLGLAILFIVILFLATGCDDTRYEQGDPWGSGGPVWEDDPSNPDNWPEEEEPEAPPVDENGNPA